jgi:hypothetical protein
VQFGDAGAQLYYVPEFGDVRPGHRAGTGARIDEHTTSGAGHRPTDESAHTLAERLRTRQQGRQSRRPGAIGDEIDVVDFADRLLLVVDDLTVQQVQHDPPALLVLGTVVLAIGFLAWVLSC